MNEFFPENTSLVDVEEFMRGVEHSIKKGMAHLAIALATIKTEGLYYQVAHSWKEYIHMERTNLGYRESLKLAKAGENFIRYQNQLEVEGIKLSDNMTKISLVDNQVAESDPMYFKRFKGMSSRQLCDYQIRKRNEIRAIPVNPLTEELTIKGSSVYIGGEKVKGLSLKEAREQLTQRKRLIAVWVDDDETVVRRVKRRLEKIL